MKQFLVILASFSLLTSFSQSRKLTIKIENIESINDTPSDSINFELTNQGFMNMGEQISIPTKNDKGRHSLLQTVNIQSDSTALKIYFNKFGFVEVINLESLYSDTLTISNFTVYPDCEQNGIWLRKTVFNNDSNGNTDYLNYEEVTKSEFDFKENKCLIPDSINMKINGLEYLNKVEKEITSGLITTGHGYTRKFWIGGKRYFHFRKEELFLIMKIKIELK